MPTTKPALGYSTSRWYGPPYTLKAEDRKVLSFLVAIDADELRDHFCAAVESAITDFKSNEQDLRQRPKDSQIRAGLRRCAKQCKDLYEFLCHPGAHGTHSQLDGISQQLIQVSLQQHHQPLETMKIARNALNALSIAAEYAEKTHRRDRASKLKGGRRPDNNTKDFITRLLQLLDRYQPNLTKAKQNGILAKVLEIAEARCSIKTIEGIRRNLEITTQQVG